MKEAKRLVTFKNNAARTKAIKKLTKDGYNYFVVYQDVKNRPAMQYAKSTSDWVKKHSKGGIFVSGK